MHPDLDRILGKSYGIVVFQEQVDELLQTFCGYTSGEAEAIREAIHERRKEDYGNLIQDQLTARMAGRGHAEWLAKHVFELIAGFKGYGFAQGHALAFAEISIRSIYCQQNFPADYFASLLSAQPAGYYGPSTLVNEARIRGVAILQPDVNKSGEEFTVEDVQSKDDPKLVFPKGGIRVALSQINGISAALRASIVENRPFANFFDFVAMCRPERDELERLILCGALDSLHPNRRAMLWAIPSAMDYARAYNFPTPLPTTRTIRAEGAHTNQLFTMPTPDMPRVIEDFSDIEKAIEERSILGLDVEWHLMSFERERVVAKNGVTSAEAGCLKPGTKAIVVGNPIRLRFPPTASGKRVVFFDLEDETGLLNVTCFDDVYQRDGAAIVCNPFVAIRGEAQDRDGHIAFLAKRVFPFKPSFGGPLPIVTGDFLAK